MGAEATRSTPEPPQTGGLGPARQMRSISPFMLWLDAVTATVAS